MSSQLLKRQRLTTPKVRIELSGWHVWKNVAYTSDVTTVNWREAGVGEVERYLTGNAPDSTSRGFQLSDGDKSSDVVAINCQRHSP